MASISHRAQKLPASPIRKLGPFADAAKARGIRVHHLNIGQPDVATPRGMIEAYRSYDEKVLAYGPSQGLPGLRSAIAKYFVKLGINLEPDHVNVTFGGSEAVGFAFSAVTDPGDEILTTEPFYANYLGFAASTGVTITTVPARADHAFHLPSDAELEAAITPKTKAMIVCSPNNPTGTVYTKEEMERLGKICEKHDLYLISDEVYREFAYGETPTSALSLPCAHDRVIVVDSVSKRFSACGARVGCVITKNPTLLNVFMRMCFARLCPATVDQIAAIAAYDTPQSYFDDVVAEYTRRRDALVKGLNSIKGVSAPMPEGAFYLVTTLPVDDADDFAKWLLTDFNHEKETVMIAPASGFYGHAELGKRQARIAYVLEVPHLLRSVELLRIALDQYPGRRA